MTLQPGCRFVVAPHFHLSADWSRRLLIGTGVEEADGCFFPIPSWRPATANELADLLQPSEGPISTEELEASISLFQLPGHLGSEWWKLLEQAAGVLGDGHLPGFETFVSQITEFLTFKSLPIPEGARCTVVVSEPGQRSVNWRPEIHGRGGLLCTLTPATPWPETEVRGPRLWGGINLGDEETSIVLVNLSYEQMDAELHRRFPDRPPSSTVGELVGQFLRTYLDYPIVRLILGPGEGYRLPVDGLILDSYLAEKQEPDVLLLISQ